MRQSEIYQGHEAFPYKVPGVMWLDCKSKGIMVLKHHGRLPIKNFMSVYSRVPILPA